MAFQTSCVSAANIVTGLTFQQDVVADAEGREMVQHGSALFPIACYAENLKSYSVAWHWHEEFEYILAMKGPLTVDVNKTRVTLQTNQGVFLNSGILHAVEQAPEGTALLHSGVFHPRLVGGMDTIFWQKLIRPMLQPDAPAFFLLDGAQLPADAGHHAHPVCQAVPGGKGRRAAPFHPAQDGRDRDGVRLCRWQLLHQDLPGDQALHTQGIPRKILLKCLR